MLKRRLSQLKVDFLGRLTNTLVLENLASSSILILPSRREGLPLVILEALALDVIPVAADVGGIADVLHKDFLVEDTEQFIDDFSDKVVKIIKSNNLPKTEIINYTWESIIKKEIKLIKQITFDSDS